MQGCAIDGNVWTAIISVCWVLNLVLEKWLGSTTKVKSASTIDLLIAGVALAAALLSRKEKENGKS